MNVIERAFLLKQLYSFKSYEKKSFSELISTEKPLKANVLVAV